MKKITSLLLVILSFIMVLSLASCNKKTTEEIINGAIEKTSALTEYEAKMNITIDMAMQGMTMSIPMNVVTKVKDADKENPIISATTTTSMLGQSMSVESYMDGEYVYISEDGEGYKMSLEDAMGEYDYASDIDDMLKKMPEDLIKDIELTEGDDGSYKLTVSIPNETFEEIFGDFVDDMNEASAGEIIEELEISDCKVVITVKNDYVSNYDISFKMAMSVGGVETNSTVTANMEFVNPGEAVTVTPPEGYQDFEDFSDLGGFDW